MGSVSSWVPLETLYRGGLYSLVWLIPSCTRARCLPALLYYTLRCLSLIHPGGVEGLGEAILLVRRGGRGRQGALMKGAVRVLRLSPGLLFREFLRRVTGHGYVFNGIHVVDLQDFRALVSLMGKGYRVWGDKGLVYLETGYGRLVAPSVTLLRPSVEDIIYYDVLNVKGKDILDIGAGIGDSVVFFVKRGGAKRVYAYEPVFYEFLEKNIALNAVRQYVEAFRRGIHYKREMICVSEEGAETGLNPGNVCFDAEPLGDVLRRLSPDVVKMDCEGCEYSILLTPCNELRVAKQWLIEVHGASTLLVDKMRECGFTLRERIEIERLVSINYFVQSQGR